jgi:hypothetical protein
LQKDIPSVKRRACLFLWKYGTIDLKAIRLSIDKLEFYIETGDFMKCPICGNEMLNGEIVFKNPWPGALYPDNPNDSELKRAAKMFFGSKSAIGFSGADEGWYCIECKKVVAVLNTDK